MTLELITEKSIFAVQAEEREKSEMIYRTKCRQLELKFSIKHSPKFKEKPLKEISF